MLVKEADSNSPEPCGEGRFHATERPSARLARPRGGSHRTARLRWCRCAQQHAVADDRGRGRQRTGWSDAAAAPGIERPLSHPQLIFSKSLTQPESVMDDVAYSSTAGLPPRWLEPLRIAAHDLTQRLLEASAALSTSGAGAGLERRGPAPGRRGPRGRRAARLTREPSLPTGIDPPTPQFRPQDIDRSRLCAILTRC